jgi:DNA-directed RNA polymerase subunit RPC12/RpoP
MPRRSKLDLEAMRASLNVDCPHCHAALSPAEYMRLDSERLRCTKCGKDFEPPQRSGTPMRTN